MVNSKPPAPNKAQGASAKKPRRQDAWGKQNATLFAKPRRVVSCLQCGTIDEDKSAIVCARCGELLSERESVYDDRARHYRKED